MKRPGTRAASFLALLAVLGLHVTAKNKPPGELGIADRMLLAVTGPVQNGLGSVAGGVTDGFNHYLLLVGAAKENDRLHLELAASRSALSELNGLRRENQRLRELAGLREAAPGSVQAASVIGRGTSPRFHTLRIDQGHGAGLQAGMAVVSVAGVVGQVLRVSRNYADVLLITDGLSSAGAMVEKSGLRGLAVGDSSDQMKLSYLRRTDAGGIQQGDLVVSSGEDGVFPEGVPLARILKIDAPESGLFMDVELEPAAPLARLEEVLVVLDPGSGPFHIPLPEELSGWEEDAASVDDGEEP